MAKRNNLRVFGLQLALVMPVVLLGMLAAKCIGDDANKIESYSIQNPSHSHNGFNRVHAEKLRHDSILNTINYKHR